METGKCFKRLILISMICAKFGANLRGDGFVSASQGSIIQFYDKTLLIYF